MSAFDRIIQIVKSIPPGQDTLVESGKQSWGD